MLKIFGLFFVVCFTFSNGFGVTISTQESVKYVRKLVVDLNSIDPTDEKAVRSKYNELDKFISAQLEELKCPSECSETAQEDSMNDDRDRFIRQVYDELEPLRVNERLLKIILE